MTQNNFHNHYNLNKLINILPDWKVALYRAVKVAAFFHLVAVLLGLVVSLRSSTTLGILWSISNAMTAPYGYFACTLANARLRKHRVAVKNNPYRREIY